MTAVQKSVYEAGMSATESKRKAAAHAAIQEPPPSKKPRATSKGTANNREPSGPNLYRAAAEGLTAALEKSMQQGSTKNNGQGRGTSLCQGGTSAKDNQKGELETDETSDHCQPVSPSQKPGEPNWKNDLAGQQKKADVLETRRREGQQTMQHTNPLPPLAAWVRALDAATNTGEYAAMQASEKPVSGAVAEGQHPLPGPPSEAAAAAETAATAGEYWPGKRIFHANLQRFLDQYPESSWTKKDNNDIRYGPGNEIRYDYRRLTRSELKKINSLNLETAHPHAVRQGLGGRCSRPSPDRN